MTSPAESPPTDPTPARQVTGPLRELVALVLLGANAVFLFVGLARLLAPQAYSTFMGRAGSSFFAFIGAEAIILPVLAVLLATHVAPVVSRAKLITQVALGEYAASAVLGGLTLLVWLVDRLAEAQLFDAVAGLLSRGAWLALFGAAGYVVWNVWRRLYHVPRPKPQPGVYGTPQPGWPQPGGPDQPGGYPGAGQPGGYAATGQPGGYPAAGQPGGYPATGQQGGYGAAGQPGYPGAGQPGGYAATGQPGYPGGAWPVAGQPTPEGGPASSPHTWPPHGQPAVPAPTSSPPFGQPPAPTSPPAPPFGQPASVDPTQAIPRQGAEPTQSIPHQGAEPTQSIPYQGAEPTQSMPGSDGDNDPTYRIEPGEKPDGR